MAAVTSIDELVAKAATEAIYPDDVRSVATALGTSNAETFDQFARTLAERFFRGECSWEFGDTAINALWTCASLYHGGELPDFAWQVFIAFDEGEYIHGDGSPELDGEPRTRVVLTRLLGSSGS